MELLLIILVLIIVILTFLLLKKERVFGINTEDNSEKDKVKIIESKGLQDRVKLVTDFLDDDAAISTLAKCELLVFPYQNTKESASGAVRMGVASGVPIAVSPIPIFDDVNGAIRMRGGTVEDIVASISMLSQEDLDTSKQAIVELRDSLQWDEVAKRI